MIDLPPLPVAAQVASYPEKKLFFTAAQMTAYGKQCALAQMEKDAKRCESWGESQHIADQFRLVLNGAAKECAAAIRNQTKE